MDEPLEPNIGCFFFSINLIAAFLVGFMGALLGSVTKTDQNVLVNIDQLAVLMPSIAVGCRRMHDTARSGWWLFVPIVSLIFALEEGTKGDKKFGPHPWGRAQGVDPT